MCQPSYEMPASKRRRSELKPVSTLTEVGTLDLVTYKDGSSEYRARIDLGPLSEVQLRWIDGAIGVPYDLMLHLRKTEEARTIVCIALYPYPYTPSPAYTA